MKKYLLIILLLILLLGCSFTEKTESNGNIDSSPAEKEQETAEIVEISEPKPTEKPITAEEKEMLASVFNISTDDAYIKGIHGTADLGGVLITLDDIVMLKGTDGLDLILPIWSAQNTNDDILNIFSHIMSNVIGPGNSMVDTRSRPDSYPVESLSRIPNLDKGENASFYYYVSEYVKGYYVATMYQADRTGDFYYFVFEVE